MHKSPKRERRTLERRLAEELTKEELQQAMGGAGFIAIATDSVSGGAADD